MGSSQITGDKLLKGILRPQTLCLFFSLPSHEVKILLHHTLLPCCAAPPQAQRVESIAHALKSQNCEISYTPLLIVISEANTYLWLTIDKRIRLGMTMWKNEG
jgi:hypothetical protein